MKKIKTKMSLKKTTLRVLGELSSVRGGGGGGDDEKPLPTGNSRLDCPPPPQ